MRRPHIRLSCLLHGSKAVVHLEHNCKNGAIATVQVHVFSIYSMDTYVQTFIFIMSHMNMSMCASTQCIQMYCNYPSFMSSLRRKTQKLQPAEQTEAWHLQVDKHWLSIKGFGVPDPSDPSEPWRPKK